MKQSYSRAEVRERWARLRFSIVARLLAAPPRRGELKVELDALARRTWKHPVTGAPVCFGRSTIERWYYRARKENKDPIKELRRRERKDAGLQVCISEALEKAILEMYRLHPSWSRQLIADNMVALAREDAELGKVPSVASIRRFMTARGLTRRKRRGPRKPTDGSRQAERRFEELEVRSFEAEYVHGLWHLDFHESSRAVLTPEGEWRKPAMLGILDDRSRLACHVQWYWSECAENLVHGLIQAIQKWGLPRAILMDNGMAMLATECREGFLRLGISQELTLAYSPYQNGKQEAFWNSVEGRLLAMLDGESKLSLGLLAKATAAWVDLDYNRRRHSEIGMAPFKRYLEGPTVGRPSPSSVELRSAFRRGATRKQRRSDGTLSLEGRRFEVPSRFGHMERLSLRYAGWDLSQVEVADERSGALLAHLLPLDRAKNADGFRRRRSPAEQQAVEQQAAAQAQSEGMAPLLRQLIEDYSATGLPPAYLPKDELDADGNGEQGAQA